METEKELQNLIDKIKKRPDTNIELVEKAYFFAKEAHEKQKRKNGEPYFIHPLAVANTLAEMQLDDKSIAAAFLHDVVEDTKYSIEMIEKEFDKEVAFLVDGVTKLKKLRYRLGKKTYLTENLRKMFVAMSKDIRVILIKLADRLHNMETIEYVDEKERHQKAQEVLEIYAPIAQRLGIGEFRDQLEDIAFEILYPAEYAWVYEISEKRFKEADEYLKKVKKAVQKYLKESNIEAEIHTRKKHVYSLYKKLLVKEKNINEIYDLVAIRIIVNTISECYETLGIIHKNWFPLLGHIKDYISLPKPNGYRSLHTTVFCLEGKITEFQIRTWQMHYESEYGVAAHWYYADKKKDPHTKKPSLKKDFRVPKVILDWVQDLSNWQEEIKKNDTLLDSLKIDILNDRIFVFTPQGDVIDLPKDSTPIDFAYSIHTQVGNRCLGTKVNGKLVEISHKLENGDIVEILRSKNKKNSNKDWLKFVKTAKAKTAIRKALKEK